MKQDDKFKNIEYIEVLRNGDTVLLIDGSKINNKTKFDLQKLIGDEISGGRFYINVKEKNVYKPKSMSIRAIKVNGEKEEPGKTISIINPNLGSKMIDAENLNILKATYEVSLNQLKDNLAKEERKNEKLETENKKLLNEQYESRNKITSLEAELKKIKEEQNGGGGMLEMIQQFLQMKAALKGGITSPVNDNLTKIKSDSSDIPPEFLEALGKVDYSQVPQEVREQYVTVFNQVANNLPLKKVEE